MAKKLTFDLHTAVAWLIWAILLTYAYLHPNPQFPSYAIWLTTGTLGYSGKRLLQKRKEFNGKREM
jgi:hypothetical protein